MKTDRSLTHVSQKNVAISRRGRIAQQVDAKAAIEKDPSIVDAWFQEFLASGHYTRLPQKVRRRIPMAVEATREYLFAHDTRSISEIRPFEIESFFVQTGPRNVVVDDEDDFVQAAVDWLLWLCQSSKLMHGRFIEKTVRDIKDQAVIALKKAAV